VYSFRWITIFQGNMVLGVEVRMVAMQFDYTSRLYGKWSLRSTERRGDRIQSEPIETVNRICGKISPFRYLYHLQNEANSGCIQTHI
jgi:hypothetical protein